MSKRPDDLPFDQALQIVLEHARPLGTERVAISDALGRVLAEDMTSQREHPPWDNSAMDGFAVKWEDVAHATPESPVTLTVIGEVQAGGMSSLTLAPGQSIEIMTGAPVPAGADSVVRVEDTERDGDWVKILKPCAKEGNVRFRGEDVRIGDVVIPAATRIRPGEAGMMATAGLVWARVHQQPRAAVLATGDELAEPGEPLAPEKIVNSNAYSVTAQVAEAGGLPIALETARDTRENLELRMRQALSADIGIVIGGVSVGKYDFVKDILAEIGCEIKFWRVQMRPGHPVVFGVLPTPGGAPRLLFGLPGNPVACMVAFYQFVRPAIRKMMGMDDLVLPVVMAELQEDVANRPGRRHFARAVTHFEDGRYVTRLTGAQGSGILTSMVQANSFMVLTEEVGQLSAGNLVPVQLLPST
jgi:molybdopterin molybdotransferase